MTLGLWTLIGMFAAAAALRFAMRATSVDAEHLYAALSAYLLAGIFFGNFYWVLEQIGPGTFAAAGDFSRMSAIYFSFVTLATLGYGDIVPRTDVARGLAIVEGVGGQLFLAVMVARLVSLYARAEREEIVGTEMEMSGKDNFPGRLFIVEKIDGSGKSMQLSLLHRWLESEGHTVVFSEWNSSPLVKNVTRRGKKKGC
jgi:voltage-gated potassium channel Kch